MIITSGTVIMQTVVVIISRYVIHGVCVGEIEESGVVGFMGSGVS